MIIRNATRGTELANAAWVARSYASRMVGLMGRASLEPGEALVLDPASSVHTAFMRFAIDVVYLDRSKRVVKAVSALKPYRVSGVLRGARSVVEFPSGVVEETGTVAGDELVFEE